MTEHFVLNKVDGTTRTISGALHMNRYVVWIWDQRTWNDEGIGGVRYIKGKRKVMAYMLRSLAEKHNCIDQASKKIEFNQAFNDNTLRLCLLKLGLNDDGTVVERR